jgi:hypothetical protein
MNWAGTMRARGIVLVGDGPIGWGAGPGGCAGNSHAVGDRRRRGARIAGWDDRPVWAGLAAGEAT